MESSPKNEMINSVIIYSHVIPNPYDFQDHSLKNVGFMSSNVLPQKNESFGMNWHLTGYNLYTAPPNFLSIFHQTCSQTPIDMLVLNVELLFLNPHKHLSCLGYNLSNDLLADISFWQLFFSWHIVFMCCQGTQVCSLKSPAVSAQASVFLIKEKPPTVTVCHSPQELQQGVQKKRSPRHAPLLQTGTWMLSLSQKTFQAPAHFGQSFHVTFLHVRSVPLKFVL